MSFCEPSTLLLREEYAVQEDNLVDYRNPGIALPVADALTELLRSGARELLQQAVEAEVAEFVLRHRELKDERERQRVVRNGYQPERTKINMKSVTFVCRSKGPEIFMSRRSRRPQTSVLSAVEGH